MRRKVCAGVLCKSNTPDSPQTMLVATMGIMARREMFSFWEYAPPLAVVPAHRASVLVAFAGMGGTPVNRSAGKATKPPPFDSLGGVRSQVFSAGKGFGIPRSYTPPPALSRE